MSSRYLPGWAHRCGTLFVVCASGKARECNDVYGTRAGEIRTAEDVVTGPDSRSTTAPFSKEEIELIKQAILTPGALVECPRCGTLLKTDPYVATEKHKTKVLWVFCETWKRNLIVRDLPTDRDGSP